MQSSMPPMPPRMPPRMPPISVPNPMPIPSPLTVAQMRERQARWLAIVAQGRVLHRLVSGSAGWAPAMMPTAPAARRAVPPVPAQCRYGEAQILRVPLVLTDRAREALWRGHHEARQFPQALEEHFAAHSGVVRIVVDCCPRAEVGIAELRRPESLTPPAHIPPHRVKKAPGSRHATLLPATHPDFPAHLHPDRAVVRVTIHHRLAPVAPDPEESPGVPPRIPHYSDPPLPVTYPPHDFYLPLYTFGELHPDTHLPAMRAATTAAHLLSLYPHPTVSPQQEEE